MKLLDVDWQAFLQMLDTYRRLPYPARRVLVQHQPSVPMSNATMGEWREAFFQAGILVPGPQGKNARLDAKYQGFVRVLRAFHRSRIFDAPSRETYHAYVSENLDGPEIAAFSGPNRQYYYYQNYAAVEATYPIVCVPHWVRHFLDDATPSWELPYQAPGHTAYLSSSAVCHAAEQLIRVLIPGAAPVPVVQLPGMCSDVRLVCHQHNRQALVIQLLENIHDLD